MVTVAFIRCFSCFSWFSYCRGKCICAGQGNTIFSHFVVQRGDFTVAIVCVPCGPRRSLIYAWAWGFCVCWKLSAAEKVKPDCCCTPAVVSTLLSPLPGSLSCSTLNRSITYIYMSILHAWLFFLMLYQSELYHPSVPICSLHFTLLKGTVFVVFVTGTPRERSFSSICAATLRPYLLWRPVPGIKQDKKSVCVLVCYQEWKAVCIYTEILAWIRNSGHHLDWPS